MADMAPTVTFSKDIKDSFEFNCLQFTNSGSLSYSTAAGSDTSTNFKLDLNLAVWAGIYNVVNMLPHVSSTFTTKLSSVAFPLNPGAAAAAAAAAAQPPVQGSSSMQGVQMLTDTANTFANFGADAPDADDDKQVTVTDTSKRNDDNSLSFSQAYEAKDCMIMCGHYGMEIKDLGAKTPHVPLAITAVTPILTALPSLLGFLNNADSQEETTNEATDKDNTEDKTVYEEKDTTVTSSPVELLISSSQQACALTFSGVKVKICTMYSDETHSTEVGKKYTWYGSATLTAGSDSLANEKKKNSDQYTDLFTLTLLNGQELSEMKNSFLSMACTLKNTGDTVSAKDLIFRIKDIADTKLDLVPCCYADGTVTLKRTGGDATLSMTHSDPGSGSSTSPVQFTENSITAKQADGSGYSEEGLCEPSACAPVLYGSDYLLLSASAGSSAYTCSGAMELFTFLQSSSNVTDATSDWKTALSSKDTEENKAVLKALGLTTSTVSSSAMKAFKIKLKGSDGKCSDTQVTCRRSVSVEGSNITIKPEDYTLKIELVFFSNGSTVCYSLAVDRSGSSAGGDFTSLRFANKLSGVKVQNNILVSADLATLFTTNLGLYATSTSFGKVGAGAYKMFFDFVRLRWNDTAGAIELCQLPAIDTDQICEIIKDDSTYSNIVKYLTGGLPAVGGAALCALGIGALAALGPRTLKKPKMLFEADRNKRGVLFSCVGGSNILNTGSGAVDLNHSYFSAGGTGGVTMAAGQSSKLEIKPNSLSMIVSTCQIQLTANEIILKKAGGPKVTLESGKLTVSIGGSTFTLDDNALKHGATALLEK